MLERFLDDLGSEASRLKLPWSEVNAVVEEARTHLEDSIQARLELDATPEAAEREAIKAFGSARRIAHEASAVRASRLQGRRLVLFTLASFLFFVASIGFDIVGLFAWSLAALPLLLIVCPLTASLVVRRSWPSFALAVAVFWLSTGLFHGLTMGNYNGLPVPRVYLLKDAEVLETNGAALARSSAAGKGTPNERKRMTKGLEECTRFARERRAAAAITDWPLALDTAKIATTIFAIYLTFIYVMGGLIQRRPRWGTRRPWRPL